MDERIEQMKNYYYKNREAILTQQKEYRQRKRRSNGIFWSR